MVGTKPARVVALAAMRCEHEKAVTVVYNDLAPKPATNLTKEFAGGLLAVNWCRRCGAIRRRFPGATILGYWELPEGVNSAEDLDGTG